jgi:hypothetical protein
MYCFCLMMDAIIMGTPAGSPLELGFDLRCFLPAQAPWVICVVKLCYFYLSFHHPSGGVIMKANKFNKNQAYIVVDKTQKK